MESYKPVSDCKDDTFSVVCDRHVISWLLRNVNVDRIAMNFLGVLLFSELKKNGEREFGML